MPSRVKGIISTRRLLKRVPDVMRQELGDAMTAAGPEIAGRMEAAAPRGKTGRLVAGIGWKFYPATLRLVVGFIGKRLNRQLFYARIIEFGRRARTVEAHRLSAADRVTWAARRRAGTARAGVKPVDLGSTYPLRVKAMAARHFVYGPATNTRVALNRRLNGIWDRVLRRVAGSGNDE